ncbi:MAG: peptide chain release factor N(5)-glutamine methyltransferase [Saprospiraceae bacterium]
MTGRDYYELLSSKLVAIYDEREASTIARYIIEDVTTHKFWSEEALNEQEKTILDHATEKLLRNEPWQYVGGYADFYGLKFNVCKHVLIPRPETEELVFLALDIIKKEKLTSALDIGTGSGIIPITLAKKSSIVDVFAIDISLDALEVAKSNAIKHDVDVKFSYADILDEKAWVKLPVVDMVISNPPYIIQAEKHKMHPNVLDYEPHIALFVADDPLLFYKAIVKFTMNHQKENCIILVEINEKYAEEVCEMMQNSGLRDVFAIKDMQDKDRMVIARK